MRVWMDACDWLVKKRDFHDIEDELTVQSTDLFRKRMYHLCSRIDVKPDQIRFPVMATERTLKRKLERWLPDYATELEIR